MTGFCSNCGIALPPSARFCSACGTAVSGMPSGSVPPLGYAPGSGYQGYPPYPGYPGRLSRPVFGRQFAGVCVGLSRNYGWDVGLVRGLTVVAGVFLFPIVEIAYIACWIGIPEESLAPVQAPPPPPQVERA